MDNEILIAAFRHTFLHAVCVDDVFETGTKRRSRSADAVLCRRGSSHQAPTRRPLAWEPFAPAVPGSPRTLNIQASEGAGRSQQRHRGDVDFEGRREPHDTLRPVEVVVPPQSFNAYAHSGMGEGVPVPMQVSYQHVAIAALPCEGAAGSYAASGSASSGLAVPSTGPFRQPTAASAPFITASPQAPQVALQIGVQMMESRQTTSSQMDPRSFVRWCDIADDYTTEVNVNVLGMAEGSISAKCPIVVEDPTEHDVLGSSSTATLQTLADPAAGSDATAENTPMPPNDLLHFVEGESAPRDSLGNLTSVGTARHQFGDCRPCHFWFAGSCRKGVSCVYCHVPHPGQRRKRMRPSKHTRQRMRDALAEGTNEDEQDSTED